MHYLAASIILTSALLGVPLTLLTLPGVWLIVLAAILCTWWQPGLLSPWTLGVAVTIAFLGEAIELIASALGASKAGASRTGAAWAVGGAIVGAIVGTFIPPPPIGTILGGVAGAGLAAAFAERHLKGRTWEAAGKAATGAAMGRLVATVAKVGVCAAVGILLTIAAFWP